MYKIMTKAMLFSAWDQGFFIDQRPRLKSCQDTFILSELTNVSGAKIAEIGGGHSRLLPILSARNECWNLDPFDGSGQGPTDVPDTPNVKTLQIEVGAFSDKVSSEYFDFIFSVSVVEHINDPCLASFFLDIERMLAPGGATIHAIDCYLGDGIVGPKIDRYRNAVVEECKSLEEYEAAFPMADTRFHSSYVSDPDINMWKRNNLVPALAEKRQLEQCVSLCAGWRKLAAV